MADIKLFNIKGHVEELQSKQVTLEKELQQLLEENMNTFFALPFLNQNIELQMEEWTVLALMKIIVL